MTISDAPTDRTRLGRHHERGTHDRDELYAVLDAGSICHLGIVMNGGPAVFPTAFGRIDDTLYLHGSVAAHNLTTAGQAPDVCVTVTHLDGLVLARSVFSHSMNYRSAMVFGTPRTVTDPDEVLAGLRAVVEQTVPGQWDAARRPTRKDLAATTVLALGLDEASVKIRRGPPGDADDPDADPSVWAGVLPVRQVWGEPWADPARTAAVPLPGHLARLPGTRLDDDPETTRIPT